MIYRNKLLLSLMLILVSDCLAYENNQINNLVDLIKTGGSVHNFRRTSGNQDVKDKATEINKEYLTKTVFKLKEQAEKIVDELTSLENKINQVDKIESLGKHSYSTTTKSIILMNETLTTMDPFQEPDYPEETSTMSNTNVGFEKTENPQNCENCNNCCANGESTTKASVKIDTQNGKKKLTSEFLRNFAKLFSAKDAIRPAIDELIEKREAIPRSEYISRQTDWSEWSNWSECNQEGRQSRQRNCVNTNCDAKYEVHERPCTGYA